MAPKEAFGEEVKAYENIRAMVGWNVEARWDRANPTKEWKKRGGRRSVAPSHQRPPGFGAFVRCTMSSDHRVSHYKRIIEKSTTHSYSGHKKSVRKSHSASILILRKGSRLSKYHVGDVSSLTTWILFVGSNCCVEPHRREVRHRCRRWAIVSISFTKPQESMSFEF
jgi:hypothetical protein